MIFETAQNPSGNPIIRITNGDKSVKRFPTQARIEVFISSGKVTNVVLAYGISNLVAKI